jgi:murein DD-endopeptidase MepM/ murein hydrolase activator NlpD
MNYILHRLGLVVAGLLVVANLALLPVLVSAAVDGNQPRQSQSSSLSDSPNVITQIAANTIDRFNGVSAQVSTAAARSGRAITTSGLWLGRSSASGVQFVGDSLAKGLRLGTLAAVRSFSGSVTFASAMPGSMFESVTGNAIASAVIHPKNTEQVPVIDTGAALVAAFSAQSDPDQSALATSNPANQNVVWPIHGAITTLFGVPELPYQAVHTGLDISDGARSGVTPIYAFKTGTVIEVIHERTKLGNEVVVDHGGGLTSVYGHLFGTTVSVGQAVTTSTILGTEGSTGVSTGTHLHFEIRLGGTPVNPLLYIPGRP